MEKAPRPKVNNIVLILIDNDIKESLWNEHKGCYSHNEKLEREN